MFLKSQSENGIVNIKKVKGEKTVHLQKIMNSSEFKEKEKLKIN